MFITSLQLEKLGRKTWKVLSPLVWKFKVNTHFWKEELSITVPVDFVTDLASIPNWLQGLPYLQVNSRTTSPAVLHDYLYVNQKINWEHQGTKFETKVSRKFADKLLKDALIAENEHKFVAWIYYIFVRAFGRFGWNRNAKRNNSLNKHLT